nr:MULTISPECIES: LacI family DNA-binding transcriptional regulator [unclassified Leucobacter]
MFCPRIPALSAGSPGPRARGRRSAGYAEAVQADRRATIKDVAIAAGVSPTTVSHALNGKGVVRKATVERIQKIADEVGYRPSALARGLRESHMGLIGLIIRPLDSLETFLPEGVDYFMRFAGSAALTAMERGYGLMLVSDPTKPGAPVSTLAADACIVTDPVENDPVLTLLQRQRIPSLSVGADPARPHAFPSIGSSTALETTRVLDHLESAGARRVAIVVGTDRNEWNLTSRASYVAWCIEHGQEPLVLEQAETIGEAAGEVIAAEVLDTSPADTRPDAVYCLTGRHAAGLVAAAQARGIRVPTDLLVVGGSDALQNRVGSPTVTAVDLRPELLARSAVELAVRLAEGQPVEPLMHGPQGVLHIRESTTR